MKKVTVFTRMGLLVVGMALLEGCGGKSSTPAAAPASAPAKEIIVGNLQDLSGPTSVLGNAVTRGVELAIDKMNSQGGINGAKVKLISLDTKGDVQEAIKAYNRL